MKKAVPAFFLLMLFGCVLSSKPEREERGIAGTWKAHEPYMSAHKLYKGYMCFDENGGYSFFDASFDDSVSATKITGLQWNSGTWKILVDSLLILETQWAFFNHADGIGTDWKDTAVFRPHPDSTKLGFKIVGDSLYLFFDGKTRGTVRETAPNELKGVCRP